MLWAQFEFHAIPLDPITNFKNYCNTCICLSTCNVSLQYMYHSLSGHYLPVHGSFHIGSHNIKYIGQRYKLNHLLSDFLGANIIQFGKMYLTVTTVIQNIASLLYNTYTANMHFNKSYMTSLSLRFLISNDGNIIVICSNIVLMDIDAALADNCDINQILIQAMA